jgi:hypothetical protein
VSASTDITSIQTVKVHVDAADADREKKAPKQRPKKSKDVEVHEDAGDSNQEVKKAKSKKIKKFEPVTNPSKIRSLPTKPPIDTGSIYTRLQMDPELDDEQKTHSDEAELEFKDQSVTDEEKSHRPRKQKEEKVGHRSHAHKEKPSTQYEPSLPRHERSCTVQAYHFFAKSMAYASAATSQVVDCFVNADKYAMKFYRDCQKRKARKKIANSIQSTQRAQGLR